MLLLGRLLPLFAFAVAMSLAAAATQPAEQAEAKIVLQTGKNLEFGLTTADRKGLTFSADGASNFLYLQVDGKWLNVDASSTAATVLLNQPVNPARPTELKSHRANWKSEQKVSVSRDCTLTAGAQPGQKAGKDLDTCMATFEIRNEDMRDHDVGLLFVLDTKINQNDGNPFLVPGKIGLVTSSADFRGGAEMPHFVKAIEKADLAQPGLTAFVTLKIGKGWQAPDRVWLAARMSFQESLEITELRDPRDIGLDAAVTLMWRPVSLKAQGTRSCGFAFGLGIGSAGAQDSKKK